MPGGNHRLAQSPPYASGVARLLAPGTDEAAPGPECHAVVAGRGTVAPAAGAGRRSHLRSPGRTFAVLFLVLFGLTSAWSLASPVFSSADEPTHVVTAAAAVRGELPGTPIATRPPLTRVAVPAIFALRGLARPCFAFKPDQPASCERPLRGTPALVSSNTYTGRYPPLYYLIVGLPSLVWKSEAGLYLMRLVSAALCSVFLAAGLTSALRAQGARSAALGVAVATTPVAIYFSGVVNPSGLESSSAICLWASSIGLVMSPPRRAERWLVAWSGASASVLVLSRGLSPLWLLLVGLAFVGLGYRSRLAALLKRTSVRVWVGLVVAASVTAVTWILLNNSLELGPARSTLSFAEAFPKSLSLTGLRLREAVGIFGWNDTSAWAVTFYVWAALSGGLLVVALVLGSWRHRAAILFLAAATFFVPLLIESSQTYRYGLVWSGRYTLPLAAGVPILCGYAIGSRAGAARAGPRALLWLASAALALGQATAFAAALQRYAYGATRPFSVSNPLWSPPLPVLALDVAYLVIAVVLSASIVLSPRPRGLHSRRRTRRLPRRWLPA